MEPSFACAHPMVEEYLAFTAAEQKRVGVTVYRAAPLLEKTLGTLLAHMRLRAQAAEWMRERTIITRDGAPFSLAMYSMRRGSHPSFTLAAQTLRLPEARGFIVNFLFGKAFRASSEAVVVLATGDPDTCPVRG